MGEGRVELQVDGGTMAWGSVGSEEVCCDCPWDIRRRPFPPLGKVREGNQGLGVRWRGTRGGRDGEGDMEWVELRKLSRNDGGAISRGRSRPGRRNWRSHEFLQGKLSPALGRKIVTPESMAEPSAEVAEHSSRWSGGATSRCRGRSG